jgi:hypothetical protein
MTTAQLLAQLKTLTQAGRYSYLQKAAYTKLLKQVPLSSK